MGIRYFFLCWRIFAELNNPKHALSKVNFDGSKHVLALFLN